MKSKVFSADNVTVKPISIEVKVIRIGNRQMTQAVYRQLNYQWPFDNDLNWLGIPWGLVNYHYDCNTNNNSHVHLIWQRGNELRRSNISLYWGNWFSHYYSGSDFDREFLEQFRIDCQRRLSEIIKLDQLFIAV